MEVRSSLKNRSVSRCEVGVDHVVELTVLSMSCPRGQGSVVAAMEKLACVVGRMEFALREAPAP